MSVLHDAAGSTCWITVRETSSTRYLELDGCEEGAMDLRSEEPIFRYLWFHKCGALARPRLRRALVLGAGAFTAAKCLALDHPEAGIDVVDREAQLGDIGRRFFRLDRPEFARIAFHGVSAEQFLASPARQGTYDFVFDDLFDGFHHVPDSSRVPEHFRRVRLLLAEGGIFIKNVIWDPRAAATRNACDEALAALRAAFPHTAALALGTLARGHNRLLLGTTTPLSELARRLSAAGVPEGLVRDVHFLG